MNEMTRKTTAVTAFVTIIALLVSSGCVVPGMPKDGIARRQDAADLAASTIVKGKTTKKEILDRLGPPDQIMTGSEIPSARSATVWTYTTTYTSDYSGDLNLLLLGGSLGHEVSEKSYLIVYFDRRDVVTNYVSKQAGGNNNGAVSAR